MKNRKIKIYLLVISVFALISCSPKDEGLVSIDKENLNHQVSLCAPAYANNYKLDRPIILEVKNVTNQTIIFPRNFNMQLFILDQGKWFQIKEQDVERLPKEDVILSPNTQIIQDFSAFPDFPKANTNYRLRIYVTGTVQDEANTIVSSYTEVFVKP